MSGAAGATDAAVVPIDLATFSRLRGTAHSVGSVLG